MERAPHGLDRAEAAPAGDGLHGVSDDSSAMRAASTRAESTYAPGVMPSSLRNARAKLRSLMWARVGERGDREVGGEVAGDPVLKLAQRLALGGLRRKLGAELRLPAGALHEHDQPARGLERRRAAEVVLDQREREVHARRHPGRGVEVAVAHVDVVGLDGDRGVLLGEPVAARPVGGGAAPLEQAGRSQQERPGADGAHPA